MLIPLLLYSSLQKRNAEQELVPPPSVRTDGRDAEMSASSRSTLRLRRELHTHKSSLFAYGNCVGEAGIGRGAICGAGAFVPRRQPGWLGTFSWSHRLPRRAAAEADATR